MAYTPRSSLIPSETSGAIPVQIKKKRTIHAFSLIATLIFILSLLAAVGVFLYSDYLDNQRTAIRDALAKIENPETTKKIEEIKEYDDKLRIASDLMQNHISPSRIFEEIEDSTKKTVQFSSFELTHDPGFEAVVTLRGSTPGFASVALQKMEIFESNVFSDFVLQDITTTEDSEDAEGDIVPGGVEFSVTGVFDRDVIRYDGPRESNPETPSVLPIPSTTGSTTAPATATDADDAIPVVRPPLP